MYVRQTVRKKCTREQEDGTLLRSSSGNRLRRVVGTRKVEYVDILYFRDKEVLMGQSS